MCWALSILCWICHYLRFIGNIFMEHFENLLLRINQGKHGTTLIFTHGDIGANQVLFGYHPPTSSVCERHFHEQRWVNHAVDWAAFPAIPRTLPPGGALGTVLSLFLEEFRQLLGSRCIYEALVLDAMIRWLRWLMIANKKRYWNNHGQGLLMIIAYAFKWLY